MILRSAIISLSLVAIGISIYSLVSSNHRPIVSPETVYSTPEDAWATCVRIMVEGGMASDASETCDLLKEKEAP